MIRFPTTIEHGKDTDDKAGTETGSDENAMLYYHHLNTPQEQDTLLIQDTEHPEHMYGTEVSDDGKYLILTIGRDTSPSSKTWLLDLSKVKMSQSALALDWIKIVDKFGAQYSYIANDGTLFYFMTNLDAPRYKIVKYDLKKEEEGFLEHLAEHPDAILTTAFVVNHDKLLLIRSQDVKDQLTIHALESGKKLGRIGANLIGSFGQVTGKRHHEAFFFKVIGFNNPGVVYRYSFREKEGEQLFRSTVVEGLKPNNFETEQVREDCLLIWTTLSNVSRSSMRAKMVPAYPCS